MGRRTGVVVLAVVVVLFVLALAAGGCSPRGDAISARAGVDDALGWLAGSSPAVTLAELSGCEVSNGQLVGPCTARVAASERRTRTLRLVATSERVRVTAPVPRSGSRATGDADPGQKIDISVASGGADIELDCSSPCLIGVDA